MCVLVAEAVKQPSENGAAEDTPPENPLWTRKPIEKQKQPVSHDLAAMSGSETASASKSLREISNALRICAYNSFQLNFPIFLEFYARRISLFSTYRYLISVRVIRVTWTSVSDACARVCSCKYWLMIRTQSRLRSLQKQHVSLPTSSARRIQFSCAFCFAFHRKLAGKRQHLKQKARTIEKQQKKCTRNLDRPTDTHRHRYT